MAEDTGKRCTKCGEWKPWDEFPPWAGRPGRATYCKPCNREYQREYRRLHADSEGWRKRKREDKRRFREAHPEYVEWERQRKRERDKERREAVFDHYGRVCACPGCGATSNLSIDHPNGDGADHRIEIWGNQKGGGSNMHWWLVAQGFPDGYQVLCMRCNQSKGRAAACRLRH